MRRHSIEVDEEGRISIVDWAPRERPSLRDRLERWCRSAILLCAALLALSSAYAVIEFALYQWSRVP